MFSKFLQSKSDRDMDEVVDKDAIKLVEVDYKELYEESELVNKELQTKCILLQDDLHRKNALLTEQDSYVCQLEENIKVFKDVVKSSDFQLAALKEENAAKEKQLGKSVANNFELIHSRRKYEDEVFVVRREMAGLSQMLCDEKKVIRELKADLVESEQWSTTVDEQLRKEKLENENLLDKLMHLQSSLADSRKSKIEQEEKTKVLEKQLNVQEVEHENLMKKFKTQGHKYQSTIGKFEATLSKLDQKDEELKSERIRLYYAKQDLASIKERDEGVYKTLLKLAESIKEEYDKQQSKKFAGCIPYSLLQKFKTTTSKGKPYFVDVRYGYVHQLLNDLF